MVDPVGQDLLVYACKCGFEEADKKKFNNHLLTEARKDGKGIHKSLGRINPATKEVVMPPFNERSKEQKEASTHALKKKDAKDASGAIKVTEIIQDASQVRFIPRVLTATFTPIMLSGITAAQRVWGWRSDMPFENFIDTVLVHFFRDRGIELASYVITDPEEHARIKEQNTALVAQMAPGEKEEEAP